MLDNALNRIEGDNNRSHIAMSIQELLWEQGKEEEANQYNKYLPTGPSYHEEDEDESI